MNNDNNEYYIYTAHINDTLVYIGKGKDNRYKHLTSGVSHLYEANKAHFNNEEVKVNFYDKNLSEEHALMVEKLLIQHHQPSWNTIYVNEPLTPQQRNIQVAEQIQQQRNEAMDEYKDIITEAVSKYPFLCEATVNEIPCMFFERMEYKVKTSSIKRACKRYGYTVNDKVSVSYKQVFGSIKQYRDTDKSEYTLYQQILTPYIINRAKFCGGKITIQ